LDTAVDVLVAGLGPGGCAAALAARAEGLSTLAVDARGPQATRSHLVLMRPGAQAALCSLGLLDITEGRRTTTLRHVENRLRAALAAATQTQTQAPSDRSPSGSDAPLDLHWHTRVADLALGADRVRVTLHDEVSGAFRTVSARHVIDGSGGRLEALGRPVRASAGPSHLVIAAEYTAAPWFEGIVGVRDASTQELYLLFPTWGRKGVIAYFDAPPDSAVDGAVLAQRFDAIGESLGLGSPLQPAVVIDVCQRALLRPNADRVVPIGDSIGTVDILIGAGMSTAIEDGVDAARAIAAAQRERVPDSEDSRVRALSARLFARHRASMRMGRLMLLMRPAVARLWPSAALPAVSRHEVRPPPLLWPAVRFVFGRRPQAS
jgi:flavin-dependent dehydrogenase